MHMTEEVLIQRYTESAERNFKTAKDLFQNGHYDWALFLGQLTLEKLLKGLIIKKTNTIPPFIHDLVKLASIGQISCSDEHKEWLVEITRYHIQARCDDIKYELYKKATKEYTSIWFNRISILYDYLCSLY